MNSREMFCRELMATGRKGMADLLEHLDRMGFFAQPASTQHHYCRAGGLVEHSINVYSRIIDLAHTLLDGEEYRQMTDSLAIVALLHDIGKAGQYGKPGYIPNMLKGRPTKANPNPEPVQSTAKPYIINPELLDVDHEIRSIQIASKFIDLTEEESWAILMHNGLYGSFRYQIQGKETKLYMILHWADMWASRVDEAKEGGAEDGNSSIDLG